MGINPASLISLKAVNVKGSRKYLEMRILHRVQAIRIIARSWGEEFTTNIKVKIIQSDMEAMLDVINNPVIFKPYYRIWPTIAVWQINPKGDGTK